VLDTFRRWRFCRFILQAAMPPGGEDWELVTSPAAYGSATLGAFDRLQATLRDEHTVQMLVRTAQGLGLCTLAAKPCAGAGGGRKSKTNIRSTTPTMSGGWERCMGAVAHFVVKHDL
jgi:hypothetical protein